MDAASDTSIGNAAQLFQGLKNMERHAIRFLGDRIRAYLETMRVRNMISMEDCEEITNDAVFITLKKIGEGLFVPAQAEPTTFAIAIAKNLIGNRLQKKQLQTVSLEHSQHLPALDFDPEKSLQNKEREILLGQMLDRLGDPCRQIILLRYYDELPDDDVVTQKLTPFSTTDSLKTKRAKCMKLLANLFRRHQAKSPF